MMLPGRLQSIFVLLLFSLCWVQVQAQSFMLLRFEEDYSSLRDSDRTLYNRFKFLPVTASRNTYLSFGGEIRDEFGTKTNEDWIKDQGHNHSFLQRYSLHAELHAGSRFRIFIQLNSALENGSKYGPGPADEDELNVQNLFGEYTFPMPSGAQLFLRLGRQELNYGSGRLISVRDGNTTRQYFTGAKIRYTSPGFALDAFVLAADEVHFGLFDNLTGRQANLWGAYSNVNIQGAENLDLCYLGTRRANAQFEEGKEPETRHTLAVRYWKKGGGLSYNAEAAYQFGKFGEGNISAWTIALELGYIFEEVKFKPSFNLRNDYISGDRQAGDGNLQTFNPLYPKGGYFGFNPLIGPANLIDIHPYLILLLSKKLSIQADLAFNWRHSLQDGIYRPSGHFNAPGSGIAHRYIGTTYLISADYQFNNHLAMSCGGQYFRIGDFIKDIISHPADSKYVNVQLSFKF